MSMVEKTRLGKSLLLHYMKIKKLNMKKLFIVACLVLTSCYKPGYTKLHLNGDEPNLPKELKGLKVYSVELDHGNDIKVAVIDNQINSTTYRVGKQTKSLVLVNKQNNELIEVSQVLMENDSLIICRK